MIYEFKYLSEIILKIKEKNDNKSNILLLNFLQKHKNTCDNTNYNCKLINIFIQNRNNGSDGTDINGNIKLNLLMILNYLYEISFLEFGYYNKYEMTILLSKHFCHIRDNPIMAFSLINSLFIIQKF